MTLGRLSKLSRSAHSMTHFPHFFRTYSLLTSAAKGLTEKLPDLAGLAARRRRK